VSNTQVITVVCTVHGPMSLDATDIAQVGRGKNGWAWVVLKSTGERMELMETYSAVVTKWKAALP
jgi:hypothetical protein